MKYWILVKLWTQRNIAYPGRVAIYFIEGITAFIIFPFIWLSIYGSRQTIEGFTPSDIVTYYIVVAFISSAIVAYFSDEMREDIIKGKLSTVLVRPVFYPVYISCKGVSYRLILTPLAIITMGILTFIFPHYFALPSPLNGLFFIIAILGAFVLSTSFELLIGLGAFWFGENNALRQAMAISVTIFSGEIAPLEFFPNIFQKLALYNPFQYLFYFPVQLFLSKLSPHEIIMNFIGLITWIALCWALILLLWKKGLKRFDGAGI